MDAEKLTIFFDGSCEPRNPGGWATYGFVIRDPAKEEIVHTGNGTAYRAGHKFSTNNSAEYAALGFALKWIADQGWIGELEIFGDSKLVVHQVNDEWACNKEHLQQLRARVRELLKLCGDKWTIAWVPREQNEEADAQSREAYEEATGENYPERRRK